MSNKSLKTRSLFASGSLLFDGPVKLRSAVMLMQLCPANDILHVPYDTSMCSRVSKGCCTIQISPTLAALKCLGQSSRDGMVNYPATFGLDDRPCFDCHPEYHVPFIMKAYSGLAQAGAHRLHSRMIVSSLSTGGFSGLRVGWQGRLEGQHSLLPYCTMSTVRGAPVIKKIITLSVPGHVKRKSLRLIGCMRQTLRSGQSCLKVRHIPESVTSGWKAVRE